MTVAFFVPQSMDKCVRAMGLVRLGFVFAINIGLGRTAPSARIPRPVVPEKVAMKEELVFVLVDFPATTATLTAL